jgi:hypothetical protein
MKKIKKLQLLAVCLFSIGFTSSCSSDDVLEDINPVQTDNELHTCKVVFDVTKTDYDDSSTRSSSGWEDGDKIYLTFEVSSGTAYGEAVYSDGSWVLSYYGNLTAGVSSNCTATYIENAGEESGSLVKLTAQSGIYEDTNGKYLYSDGTLSVTADLSPKQGRVRFAGTDKTKLKLYGVTYYTSFYPSNGKYTQANGFISLQVSGGYTPYVYGEFTDSEEPRFNVIMDETAYARLLPTSIFQKGQSGYMTIPTASSHNGWTNQAVFKVNGVEFTMIPVAYTSGNFLLAETETTEELYNAVTSSGTTTSQLPQKGITYNDWNAFLTKINALTGLTFRKPTVSEWQYAYKGGSKSQGYTYSGSNIITEVAWFSDNASGSSHNVKQLFPNELGFYDMSGNVGELTTSGSNEYFYGGDWTSTESNCKSTSSDSYTYYKYGGLRMALSNN